MVNDKLKLIVLENFETQGEIINKHLKRIRKSKDDYRIPLSQVRFANGEGKAILEDSVRAKDVFILTDIGNYAVSYDFYGHKTFMTPDEHFQDLKRVISAIRGNAQRISVIEPLLYASRQHARNGRESLDCAIALQELQSLNVNNIVTFDVHDPNVQNAIPLLPFDNFMPTNTILKEFIEQEDINFNNLLVISPDEGAMKRSRYYAAMLGCDIGMFYKLRDFSVLENGKNPIKEHKYLGREVKGMDLLIVDDMIASGGSIIDILDQLKDKEVHSIYVITTFAFFTEGYQKFDKEFDEGVLKRVYSTNLSYIPLELKNKPWFSCVDCSDFLADVIDAYNKEKSISPLFNGRVEMFTAIENLKKDKAEKI